MLTQNFTNWSKLDLSKLDTPSLIIDEDRVRHNIQLAIKYAGGPQNLRPHIKTHKCLEVAKLQQSEGITKFKCATIAEAELLGMAKAKDVLIAYALQGPKIDRFFKLIKHYPDTQYHFLIDNEKSVAEINRKCFLKEQHVSTFIDLNNGQFRTGIEVGKAFDFIKKILNHKHIMVSGLHCYDGHIRMSDINERTQNCTAAFQPVLALQNQIKQQLNLDLLIIAGGSPSFSVHASHHEVECSPGTFIFWDERYAQHYTEQKFEKAAVLASRVISKLNAYTYCMDLGHKSVASEFPFPRVAFLDNPALQQIGHSEEHLVIKSEQPDVLEVGELLLAYPLHICPTVALYENLQVVKDHQIIEEWEVLARRRKINI